MWVIIWTTVDSRSGGLDVGDAFGPFDTRARAEDFARQIDRWGHGVIREVEQTGYGLPEAGVPLD